MLNIKKMLKITACLSLLALAFGQSLAMDSDRYTFGTFEKANSLSKVLERYSVSHEIKKTLDINLSLPLKDEVNQFSWLPDYFVKTDPKRIYGALLIQQCATENQCDKVKAPEKRLYERENKIYTIAPKIPFTEKSFTRDQIIQLCKICALTGYSDINSGNIVNSDEGIAYFIDTEQRSFGKPFSKHDPLYCNYLINRLRALNIEPSARKWLRQEIKSCPSAKL